MKIVVLGNGFIGGALAQYLKADILGKRIDEIQTQDLDGYDVVINTIAKTAIDWCEENRSETFDVNTTQALRLAKITKGKHVFFSSGCIFKSENDRQINYEDSIPNPQCFYTYTKLLADQVISEIRPDAIIIRPRLIISEKSHPRNTIDKLLNYDNVITCQESATIMEDMFPIIKELIETGQSGAFNIANSGTLSPAEIMDIWGKKYRPITKDQLDELKIGKARRVSTILGSKRLKPLPNIVDRLREIKKNWI